MLNRRGYGFGAEYPIHYERRGEGWQVFDARTDEVLAEVDHEWEAMDRSLELNGSPVPDLTGIDSTP